MSPLVVLLDTIVRVSSSSCHCRLSLSGEQRSYFICCLPSFPVLFISPPIEVIHHWRCIVYQYRTRCGLLLPSSSVLPPPAPPPPKKNLINPEAHLSWDTCTHCLVEDYKEQSWFLQYSPRELPDREVSPKKGFCILVGRSAGTGAPAGARPSSLLRSDGLGARLNGSTATVQP